MSPLVSICLPVFNGQQYLSKAIDSVLAQTLTDFELLISDDGSDDASAEIISQYASKDSRIRVLQKQDRLGLFDNYNFCMSQARAKYLKLFAQDDLLEADCLAAMSQILEVIPSVTMVACERYIIEEGANSDRQHIKNEICPGLSLDGRELVFKSLISMHNYIGEPATVMLRRDARDAGFNPTYHHIGDLEYWLRLSQSGTCYFLDRPLCTFRIHQEAQSSFNKRNLLYMLDFLRLAKEFGDTLDAYGYTYEAYTNSCLKIFSETLEQAVNNGAIQLDAMGIAEKQLEMAYSTAARQSQILEDLALFREIAARSLCTLAQERRKQQEPARAKRLEQLTTSRETRLRRMLESRSWKSTKWLRDLKQRIGKNSPRQTDENLSLCPAELDDQRLYLMYLRRKISGISRSKSWKVTSAFRHAARVMPE